MNELQRLQNFLATNTMRYVIHDNNMKQVAHFTSFDVAELQERFQHDFGLLSAGSYQLKAMSTLKGGRGNSRILAFQKDGGFTTTMPTKSNMIDIEKIQQEAYQRGLSDARWDAMNERINRLEKKLEKVVEYLLSNEDSNPTEQTKNMIQSATETGVSLIEARNAFKGLSL